VPVAPLTVWKLHGSRIELNFLYITKFLQLHNRHCNYTHFIIKETKVQRHEKTYLRSHLLFCFVFSNLKKHLFWLTMSITHLLRSDSDLFDSTTHALNHYHGELLVNTLRRTTFKL
jgi:hypothetical protein